jgi:signal transduction histidine kinase
MEDFASWPRIPVQVPSGSSGTPGIMFEVVGADIRWVLSNPIMRRCFDEWEELSARGRTPRIGLLRERLKSIDRDYLLVSKQLPSGDFILLKRARYAPRFSSDGMQTRLLSEMRPLEIDTVHTAWNLERVGWKPLFTVSSDPLPDSLVLSWQRLSVPVMLSDGTKGVMGVKLPYGYAVPVLTTFMDGVAEAVAVWNIETPDLRCQFANRSFMELFGRALYPHGMDHPIDLYIPEVAKEIRRIVDLVVATGETQGIPRLRLKRRDSDGRLSVERIFKVNVAPVKRHVVTTFVDITDVADRGREVRGERRRSASLIRILENSGHSVLLLRREGDALKIVDASDGIVVLIGRPMNGIIGGSLHDLMASLGVADYPETDAILSSIRMRQPLQRRIVVSVDKINRRILDIVHVRIPETGRETRTMLVVLRDVTALEEERTRREQSDRLTAIGRLSGAIAHEINNLLQPIMGMSRSVLDNLGDGDRNVATELEQVLEHVRNAKAHVARFTSAIHPRASKRHLSEDFPKEVVAVLDAFSKELGADHPSILIERTGLLTSSSPSPPVRLSIEEIDIVVRNVVRNAVDACPGRKGKVVIDLVEAPEIFDPAYILVVSDNGSGIEPGVFSQIFDPYFTTRSATGSHGIGLSVVYRMIHDCGGVIDVMTQPGIGTTISIRVPIRYN